MAIAILVAIFAFSDGMGQFLEVFDIFGFSLSCGLALTSETYLEMDN